MNDLSQKSLLDRNMDKVIAKCFVNQKGRFKNEVYVIYEDGAREVIHSYNPTKFEFDYSEFIGKTKLEAVFYCDRKPSETENVYGRSTYGRM